MSYKLAIFDLDGTVLDTLGDLTDAVNHTLELYGLPLRTPKEIRSYLGNGARRLIELSAPTGTLENVIESLFAEFRSYYNANSAIKTAPYPGICEMLARLRAAGCRTAVLSNKPDAPVVTLCRQYFDGLFDIAAGEKDGVARKPAPDGIYPIMEALGASAADTVYIGDSEVDIDTARNAGLDCISVDWGFRDHDELTGAGAFRIVSSAEELEKAVLE